MSRWTSSGRLWLAGLTLCAGCGAAAGPPAGPKHKPTNTDEAATACPKERKAAQAAREALLGSNDDRVSARAAKRVLAHGHCEAAAALAMPVPTGTQDAVLAGVRSVREAVRDASSLFVEVRRYGQLPQSQESLIADAELTLGFAALVGKVSAPAELDTLSAAEFQKELSDAKGTLQNQAELLLQQALASAGAELVAEKACSLLASIGATAPTCP